MWVPRLERFVICMQITSAIPWSAFLFPWWCLLTKQKRVLSFNVAQCTGVLTMVTGFLAPFQKSSLLRGHQPWHTRGFVSGPAIRFPLLYFSILLNALQFCSFIKDLHIQQSNSPAFLFSKSNLAILGALHHKFENKLDNFHKKCWDSYWTLLWSYTSILGEQISS